ncbi:MAG: signal peptidase I [Verrucomicrobia bacterium]|nr:signal peptidase I [Verrucomicrobiota bacterium]MCH8528173.1 signal peptidase I [Kiritimatiellia bacterium]
MIPFYHREQKEKRKQIEHAMFCVKYARRMKEDELPPEGVGELHTLFGELKRLLREKRLDQGAALAETALEQVRKIHPAPKGAFGLRENVEVFVVVLAVALGIRTYFLQPYQIPTGSMQPTLFGITADAEYEPDWTDRFPVKWVKFLLTGARYVEVTARSNGIVGPGNTWREQDSFALIPVGGRTYRVHQEFALMVQPGQAVRSGDMIARGLRRQGDSIVVNRLTSNFIRPRRGDIVVFSTRNVPGIRPNSAYIKRLVALEGEAVSICDGELVVNGEIIREPDVFVRQQEGRGYHGYANPELELYVRNRFEPIMARCDDVYTVSAGEMMFFGDNTRRSLDGRFFGGVDSRNVIGTAFFVPWPFFDRGFFSETAGRVK